MSSTENKTFKKQSQVDDFFKKKEINKNSAKDIEVTTPITPEAQTAKDISAKKRTPPSPPSTERLRGKKPNIEVEDETLSNKVQIKDMEPPQKQTEEPSSSKKECKSLDIEGKLDGFPEEYKAFGKALCEILLKSNEKSLQELIQPMKEDIKSLLDSKKQENNYDETIEEVKEEQIELHKKCEKIERENHALKDRLNKLENKMLSNNLILHGIHEDAWELDDNRKEKVYNAIAATVDEKDRRKRHKIARSIPISSTKRIGKYRQGSNRPISICFEKKTHAETLLQSREYLPEGVHVGREFCADTEKARKVLRPILNLAKSKPQYKGKSKLEEDTLVLHGKKYTMKDLDRLPPDLSSFEASSKSNNDTIGFFGELNVLSNFHKAPFTLNDKSYHSSEQFIQEQKALHFKDKQTAKEIMAADSPLQCKLLSTNIQNYHHEEWKKVAKTLCLPGIAAKFGSSIRLSEALKNTGHKTLVESCYDQFWGTGVPLRDKECLNKEKWTNVGILGEMLMDIRDNHLPNLNMETQ